MYTALYRKHTLHLHNNNTFTYIHIYRMSTPPQLRHMLSAWTNKINYMVYNSVIHVANFKLPKSVVRFAIVYIRKNSIKFSLLFNEVFPERVFQYLFTK